MYDPGCPNVQYLEALLQEYLQDASRVPPRWQAYFREVTGGNGEAAAAGQRPSFRPTSLFNPVVGTLPPGGSNDAQVARLHDGAQHLLWAYRERGHLVDGREAVAFLHTIQEILQDPARMLLEV